MDPGIPTRTEPRALRSAVRAVAVLVAAATALTACSEEPPPAAPVAQPVKIFTVPQPGASDVYEFPGQISAILNAEPAFEVAGKIIEFPVSEGQYIEAGTVIARLDPRDFEASLQASRANVKKANTDLERYTTLFQKGVNPKADVDRAERAHEVSVADLAIAEKALEDSVLRAPFDGIVAKKLVDDFQNVKAKDPIVILQDTSTLEIQVAVPESDFATMTPGLSLDERTRRSNPRVALNNFPGRLFPARIKEFATTADPVTRTFSATFTFDPPDDISIRPGMTSRVILGGSGSEAAGGAVAIPAVAVRQDDGQAFVWRVDPQTMTVQRNPVELGEMTGVDIAVTGGLAGGEQIAISGVHQLRDGMIVRRFEK
jgi:RND family efflux transporter MFP subunit